MKYRGKERVWEFGPRERRRKVETNLSGRKKRFQLQGVLGGGIGLAKEDSFGVLLEAFVKLLKDEAIRRANFA